jgi:hypothetical protein
VGHKKFGNVIVMHGELSDVLRAEWGNIQRQKRMQKEKENNESRKGKYRNTERNVKGERK